MKSVRNQRSYRIAAGCVGVAVMAILLCSCLSFNIGDWPSRFVHPNNEPTRNWCGVVGAFAAYYLLYYVGPGIFIVLISGAYYLAAKLRDKTVEQLWLRAAGLVLITVAASSSFYCIRPHGVFNFPIGSGGVLGVAWSEFLLSRFAGLGTFILFAAMWIVGLALLADRMLIMMFNGLGYTVSRATGVAAPAWSAAMDRTELLSQIWKKLSAKQKTQPLPAAQALAQSLAKVSSSAPTAAVTMIDTDDEMIEAIEVVEDDRQEKDKVTSAAQKSKAYVSPSYEDYKLPPLELLAEPEYSFTSVQEKVVKSKAATLEKLLSEFNVMAKVVAADTGPVVTMFELELGAGVKVSQISALANDMARALGVGAVRVVAPLPGKHTIGIEVPNNEKEKVRIKDIMQLGGSRPARMSIPLFLGKDAAGEALISDLAEMPHLLIAGTTGSGKSVCINSIITSILLTKRPDEVKMILIDPKMVEMTAFNTVPHLMSPIVTETQRAVQILEWATVKMDERYSLFAEAKVKNITEYNALGPEEIKLRFNPSSADEEAKIPKRVPYIVIVIDELADLMMTSPKEIEAYIVRLAQKSRAVGIHIVLATQRPQATVVTGLIKSNMPTRIGFRVAARMDSRIILDQNGAEALLGQGDMLFLKPGTSDLIRAQGTFVDDEELKRVVRHLKEVAEPQFHPELTQLGRMDAANMEKDELFDEAARIILETNRGSVSLLQRRLSIGYARASRIIEMMAAAGILGEYKGSQAREVMMTLKEYEAMREKMDVEAENKKAEDAEDEEHSSEEVEDEEFEKQAKS